MVDPDDTDGWTCELCQNDKTQDSSLVSFELVTFIDFALSFSPRTPIVDYAHVPSQDRGLSPTLRLILTYALASRLKAMVGYMFSVPCLSPK